jgi:hypothetical protein
MIAIAVLLLLLMFVASNGNNIRSYGQLLDKTYVNENCGVSINYPSDWKFNEKIQNDATLRVNYIVEFQPSNEEDSLENMIRTFEINQPTFEEISC